MRVAAGISQVDLAQAIGRHQTAIGPYERDEYVPPRDIIERMALLLDTTAEYLFFGRNPQRSTITVAGVIGAGGIVQEGTVAQEYLPANQSLALREDQLVSFALDDDVMAPVFRRSQIVLAAATAVEPDMQIGRDGMALLRDGRVLLRRIMPAAKAGHYDLKAYDGSVLHDVEVRSVRPVWGVLSHEALSRR